jgi:hypothetical protein
MRRSIHSRSSRTVWSVLLSVALAASCKKESDKPVAKTEPKPAPVAADPPRRPDVVPKTSSALKIDGEWDEPEWSKNALRHIFAFDSGEQARPHSEVRLLHDDRNLYVGLYAADENIESSEYFDVKVGDVATKAYATGKLDPPIDGANAGIDRDGTLDNPKDDDEEWVLEIAIPLAKTGFEAGKKLPVKFARCDTPKDNIKRCGSWSGSVSLE